MAVLTGRFGWVEELFAEVRTRTEDPELVGRAALAVGRLTALGRHHAAAFALLARTGQAAAVAHSPRALEALAAAAVVRCFSGEESQRLRIEELLPTAPDAGGVTHCAPGSWLSVTRTVRGSARPPYCPGSSPRRATTPAG
ncbi:hypothetical protein OG783_33225 [Streptomyces jietaisiensis]|uniref:hypothetical protein n=1 Tax=Streptomyces griseoaurantiacus TaxID=68213 RepID=UPI00324A2AE8